MTEQKRTFPWGISILTAIGILGLISVIWRYIQGLGAVSDLSDGRAWGLWISFDLYCGVALAAGGFTLCAVVYIFHREKYHAVARPAVLTAFLGYTMVVLALLVDLGQPWYIWHGVIFWNQNSPLFEVALCVMSYTMVLALEFSPAIFEALNKSNLPVLNQFNWHIPLGVVRAIQIPLVIAGICLSTLHQSSLGTMLLMMPETLNPLWYTPILPFLFLVSAISVGPAMVIFESVVSGKALGHELKQDILSGLAKALPYILGFYLLLRLGDLAVRGDIGLIFTGYWQNLLWWAEIIIGVVLPIILFSIPKVRESRGGVFSGAVLVVFGLILNRFNVSLLALAMRPGFSYFPHWTEIFISAGVVAWGMLIIWLAYKYLPMFDHEEVEEVEEVVGVKA